MDESHLQSKIQLAVQNKIKHYKLLQNMNNKRMVISTRRQIAANNEAKMLAANLFEHLLHFNLLYSCFHLHLFRAFSTWHHFSFIVALFFCVCVRTSIHLCSLFLLSSSFQSLRQYVVSSHILSHLIFKNGRASYVIHNRR